jgi:predicted TIM-barrel fold metal-dependent hydrolase
MLNKYPFWKGIGELLLRHDELSLHTAGELPRINHPALFRLFEYCEKYQFPILFHHNAQSVGYEHKAVYVDEIREAIDQFPKLQFVWAHAGASSRTASDENYLQLIADLLQRYPNLAVDISWKVYDQEILNDDRNPREEYVRLIELHPSKFMIGSDLTGKFEGELEKQMNKYDSLLTQLSEETAQKVASANAERIYFRSF